MNHELQFPPRSVFLAILAVLVLSYGISSVAQKSRSPLSNAPPTANADDEWNAQQQKDMAKKLNLQRQEDIKKDAEKLLELATELKQSVDKTSENTLSLDVIKKADQIEKLAKSVKEKMKGP